MFTICRRQRNQKRSFKFGKNGPNVRLQFIIKNSDCDPNQSTRVTKITLAKGKKFYLFQSRRQAVSVVSSGTGRARDEILSGLLAAHEAVLQSGGLVDALEAVPVAVGDDVNGGLEAVRVVALVTAGKGYS